MFKLLKFFTFLTVLIFLVSSLNKLSNQLQGFFQSNRPQVGNSTLILERMRSVSELTTAIFVMESVVPVSQDWKVGDWTLGKTKLLVTVQGVS
jgi:hypothetical protein